MFRPALRATAATTAAVVAASVLLVGLSAPARAAGATLSPNQSFRVGSTLVAPGGGYTLVLQTDGNLVLYVTNGRSLWSTRTDGTAADHLVLQTDGNLVLYTPAGAALWNSGTRGAGGVSLSLLDTGNLVLADQGGSSVWSTQTAQAPVARSLGDRLAINASITATAFLTSANAAYTLKLVDGHLALAKGATVLWTSPVNGTVGTSAILQGDGNFVLYGSTGAVWYTGTRNSGATVLILQDDGNLVLYSPAGAVWYSATTAANTPAPGSDRMLQNQTLREGGTLTAVGGKYRLTQQGDGNLVVYGPSGPTWATNSRGWPGVHTTLQTDGNVVVYAGTGAPLYNTGTRSATAPANLLVMQGDGNLVLYGPAGAVWSSRYSPPPPVLFPPVTAPPPTSVSHYLRGLHGTAADVDTARAMGCADGRANPTGSRYIVFLAYGAQASNVAGTWGVQLTASTLRITNSAVVATANGYVDGYASCMAAASWVTVSIGTNNDGENAGLGLTGGQVWAQQVVNPIAAHAAGKQVTVAAANDIEPGFSGSADQARAWMSGFLGSSPAPFVWTGSADGCPQSGPSNASCNYGWTPRTLFDLTYGASAGRSFPLPQIYYTSQAKQWVNISEIGRIQWGQRAQYAGPLTEVVACAQAQSCYSMGAVDAWKTFWNLLNANNATRQTDLPFTTDLRIDY